MEADNTKASPPSKLDRRAFLKILASGTLSGFLPPGLASIALNKVAWPELDPEMLPASIREILRLVPETVTQEDGYLVLKTKGQDEVEQVPLLPTNWNQENGHPYNQLTSNLPWGIVLHWFGDTYGQQQSLDFYLRGFNGMRQIAEYYTSTSAHFLVGEQAPGGSLGDQPLGIVQTQKPAPDGTPYHAAHIRSLDHNAYEEGRHYFISALNILSTKYPGVRPLLLDFYAQPGVLAHMQTIAIETTGCHFDTPGNYPGAQKVANLLSVVQAIMKRYTIPAHNLMGHFEIQLSKPDPGKKFLAYIKYLIGLKALIDPDEELKMLVFGPFLQSNDHPRNGVLAYFRYLRDYLLLTTSPRQIYEWDSWSKYLWVYDLLQGGTNPQNGVTQFYTPLRKPFWQPGFSYLQPDNHEGLDLYPDLNGSRDSSLAGGVHLFADGVCIHLGKCSGLHDGQQAVFRHRLKDGVEIISSYGHLEEVANLEIGGRYLGGQIIARINTTQKTPQGFLHFSVAYGPSWEVHLHKEATIPLNVGPTWIRNFFMDPNPILAAAGCNPGDLLRNSHLQAI